MKFYHPPDPHGTVKNGVLTKKGKNVVLFKIYDGFGVPVKVLDRVRSVEVHYQNNVYTAPVETFRTKGITHQFKDEDQLILPRKFWTTTSQASLF